MVDEAQLLVIFMSIPPNPTRRWRRASWSTTRCAAAVFYMCQLAYILAKCLVYVSRFLICVSNVSIVSYMCQLSYV